LKYGFRKSSLSLLSQQVINNKVFEGWVREGKGLFSKEFPWSNSAPAFKAAPCCAHLVDLTAMTYKE